MSICERIQSEWTREQGITRIRCCFVYMFRFATFERHLLRLRDRNAKFAKFLIFLVREDIRFRAYNLGSVGGEFTVQGGRVRTQG